MNPELRCALTALCLAALVSACGQTAVRPQEPAPEAVTAKKEAKEVKTDPAPAVGKLTEAQVMARVDVDNSVFFPAAGTELDAAAQQRLAVLAERLKAEEGGIVTLYGYTDHLGSPSYNLAIAEQRVNAVAAALRRHGVALTQIRRNAVGSERVPAVCRSAQCRRLMRRVELVFGE